MSASITPAELRAAANQPYPHGSGFRVSANRAVLLRRAADALEAAEQATHNAVRAWDITVSRASHAEAALRQIAEHPADARLIAMNELAALAALDEVEP